MRKLFAVLAMLGVATCPMFAGSITEIDLFSTGMPGGVYTMSGAATGPAAVAAGVGAPWLANDTNSVWIAPTTTTFSGAGTVIPPDVNYTYATTFDLTGYDLTKPISITGRWAVDDYGAIHMNGNPVYLAGTLIAFDAGGAQYNSWHGFTIDSSVVGVGGFGFLQGVNTLAIGVNNKGDAVLAVNPTGVRVEFTGFTGTLADAAIPEPGTLVLLGGGLLALGLFRRRT
jgi:hypothetical protein